jgi:hypothetical protein
MRRSVMPIVVLAAVGLSVCQPFARADSPCGLDLPSHSVSDRVSITRGIGSNRKETWMELDGPGCIKHIWIANAR